MRRDRFIHVLKFLHIADNTEKNNKFHKVRPMIRKIKQIFAAFCVFSAFRSWLIHDQTLRKTQLQTIY